MGNQWGGAFTFASPQPKCWGDVSPPSPYNRRPWFVQLCCAMQGVQIKIIIYLKIAFLQLYQIGLLFLLNSRIFHMSTHVIYAADFVIIFGLI